MNCKSGSLYLGYRPTEKRLRERMKLLIEQKKIKSISLNANRDTIDYEYLEEK